MRAQLLHARQDGQFLGLDVADARRPQHRGDVGGDLAPVPADLGLDVDLLDVEPIDDRIGVRGGLREEVRREIEGVAQAVRGSTLITSVRWPRAASRRPVAAARLVLPTPPLPENRRIRTARLYQVVGWSKKAGRLVAGGWWLVVGCCSLVAGCSRRTARGGARAARGSSTSNLSLRGPFAHLLNSSDAGARRRGPPHRGRAERLLCRRRARRARWRRGGADDQSRGPRARRPQ